MICPLLDLSAVYTAVNLEKFYFFCCFFVSCRAT